MVDWLSLSESSGSGYQLVSVTALPNYGSARTTTLVVSGHTAFTNVEVNQAAIVPETSYLAFSILSAGTITFGGKYHGSDAWSYDPKTISYRKNGGEWVSITGTSSTTETINVSNYDYLEFKGDNASYRTGYTGYVNPSTGLATIGFSGTAHFNIYGNIMSLIDSEDFAELYGFTVNNTFQNFFGGCKIHDASKLVLPATTLANYCYVSMFKGCTLLTSVPELPATSLTEGCYSSMFSGCTSLTTTPVLPVTELAPTCYAYMFSNTSITEAPELPLTTLYGYCYQGMFQGCSSLTTAPELPATTLTEGCYMSMFNGCTSLTTPPELPATTLVINCYSGMFSNCTSLTTAPVLPATAMTNYCYDGMFQGCTSLTTAPELPATTLADSCYQSMFAGCNSLTSTPTLSATTLATSCYTEMFASCTGLTASPALPATSLTEYCYSGMFSGCTSLATVPVLPATTLTRHCYESMFRGCTNITTAPELLAAKISPGCYIRMFQDCSSLNYIKCLATDRIESLTASADTAYWVSGVASEGTFVKSSGSDWFRGESGIPNNWSVVIV